MATLAYLTFLRCTRAELHLLSREVTNFKCSSAANKIKHCYFYHQSFCKSSSTHLSDSGVGENAQKIGKDTVNSKKLHSKNQPISDDHFAKEVLKTTQELHDFHSQMKDDRIKIQSVPLGHSSHSSSKKTPAVSKYFEQSWLNYYNTTIKKEVDPSTHNDLQTKPRKKEGAGMSNKKKPESTFGALSMEISNEGNRPDQRNPNERIDEQMPEDTDERRDRRLDIPLTRYGSKGRKSFYYTRKISIFGREGKIKEAINVFEYWMMVRDRVMPTKRTFVALIGILGRVGYTDKAFELFGKMKQLGLDPEDHIYTSLFNACANSPTPAEGLKKAEYLLNHMKEKGILPNLFTVKAAMKALAVCGDFSRAFILLDETSTRLRLDTECFCHLLMACISDQEAGFRRALQVWQKMSQYGVRTDVITFNLLIRSARDCGIGDLKTFASSLGVDSLDPEISADLVLLESVIHSSDKRHGAGHSKQILEVIGTKMRIHNPSSSEQQDSNACADDVQTKVTVLCSTTSMNSCDSENISYENTFTNTTENIYNLPGNDSVPCVANDTTVSSEWREKKFNTNYSGMDALSAVSNQIQLGDSEKSLYSDILTEDSSNNPEKSKLSKISVNDLKLPSGRLALLGGASKLISFMEATGAQPDVKTFTQILACLPNDEYSEFELLTLMEKRKIKPDIDFLNDIMMRRNLRQRHDTVKDVLKIVAKLRLTPNMRTFAAISLTCLKEKEANEFLQDMKDANLEPNSVIMSHLIYISRCNFTYKMNMLKTMESLGIKPTHKIISTIEKSIAITKDRIIDAEKKKDTNSFYLSEPYQRSFQYFMRFYKVWLMRTEVYKPRHPWDAFVPDPNPKQNKGAEVK